mmetsp:Transcript_1613/g.3341  ORF Transcript_1613/g.3341 Transcript_1613/m.3341 type:complete len:110 (-) Transcript_1613:1851-2180(-)
MILLCFFAAMIMSHMMRLLYGSRPALGSSNHTTSGSPRSAIAIRTLRFIPPENVPTGLSASSSEVNLTSDNRRSTSSDKAWSKVWPSLIGNPPLRRPNRARVSRQVKAA